MSLQRKEEANLLQKILGNQAKTRQDTVREGAKFQVPSDW